MRTARVLALGATVAALTVTGCTADPDPVATPHTVESWSAEDEAEAIQEAEQAIGDRWRVRSQCLADPPNTDPSCFDEVSYGDQLTQDQTDLKDAQDYGVRYTGEPTYVRTERVDYVDLSIGPDKEIHLSACWSFEDYDIILPDGTSFIPPDEPQRVRYVYVVRKHTGEWQVADLFEDPGGIEC